MQFKSLVAAAVLSVCASAAVQAAPAAGSIVGAVGAVINSGGPGDGDIAATYDQNGLSVNYVSGVTNFASYAPQAVEHTDVFFDSNTNTYNEWFSTYKTKSASVTYDLGSVLSLDKLALWNEESSGIGSLDLWVSTDGVSFTELVGGLSPTNNPIGSSYVADVFSFASTAFQYVRFDMSDCPQNEQGKYKACGIGEVAFEVSPVPEPGTLALMAAGLGVLAVSRRRRQS
jgi:hypothetical protein